MSYQPAINQLLEINQQISAICLLNKDGNTIHTVNQWQVNGAALIQDIQGRKPAVEIQGIKYSTLQVDEIRLVASNRQNQGHIVASKIGDKGWIIAYVVPEGDIQGAYLNVAQTANKLKTLL